MKIFLAQIYLLVPFVMIKYKYYRNENISGADLLLVPFVMIKYRSVQNHLKVYIGVRNHSRVYRIDSDN